MWHALWDHAIVFFNSLSMGKNKFFSRTLSDASFQKHLQALQFNPPRSEGADQFAFDARASAGPVDPAYKIVQWKSERLPTLIYHHGFSEAAFNFTPQVYNTFKNMFLWKQPPVEANLIVVRAPFHNSALASYLEHMVHLSHFLTMLAGSVKTVEHCIQMCRRRQNEKIYVSGVSLGGWVANLHRAFFNSATAYIPLLAGAAMGEVFISGLYRRLTGSLALEYPGTIRQALNFEDSFTRVPTPNVFPLLAQYDRVVEYRRHQAAYAPDSIRVLKKGHITAIMAPALMREHILRVMGLGERV